MLSTSGGLAGPPHLTVGSTFSSPYNSFKLSQLSELVPMWCPQASTTAPSSTFFHVLWLECVPQSSYIRNNFRCNSGEGWDLKADHHESSVLMNGWMWSSWMCSLSQEWLPNKKKRLAQLPALLSFSRLCVLLPMWSLPLWDEIQSLNLRLPTLQL